MCYCGVPYPQPAIYWSWVKSSAIHRQGYFRVRPYHLHRLFRWCLPISQEEHTTITHRLCVGLNRNVAGCSLLKLLGPWVCEWFGGTFIFLEQWRLYPSSSSFHQGWFSVVEIETICPPVRTRGRQPGNEFARFAQARCPAPPNPHPGGAGSCTVEVSPLCGVASAGCRGAIT